MCYVERKMGFGLATTLMVRGSSTACVRLVLTRKTSELYWWGPVAQGLLLRLNFFKKAHRS